MTEHWSLRGGKELTMKLSAGVRGGRTRQELGLGEGKRREENEEAMKEGGERAPSSASSRGCVSYCERQGEEAA